MRSSFFFLIDFVLTFCFVISSPLFLVFIFSKSLNPSRSYLGLLLVTILRQKFLELGIYSKSYTRVFFYYQVLLIVSSNTTIIRPFMSFFYDFVFVT